MMPYPQTKCFADGEELCSLFSSFSACISGEGDLFSLIGTEFVLFWPGKQTGKRWPPGTCVLACGGGVRAA